MRFKRILFASRRYVGEKLGSKYVEIKIVDFAETVKNMNASTPVVFILSAGIDPTRVIGKLYR